MGSILSIFLSVGILEVAINFTRSWLMGAFGPIAQFWDTKLTFIGVMHHECSHALFGLLTGAKIYEFNIFNLFPEDGTLGSVLLGFSTNPILGGIQAFASSIAPVIMAMVTTCLLANYLLKDFFDQKKGLVKTALSKKGIIFLLLATPILYHATLSTADILACLKGIWVIILTLIIIAKISPKAIKAIDERIKAVRNLGLFLLLIPFTLGLVLRFVF